ncbi:MAG: ribosome biogenesis GTPase Der [Thermoanaerobaculales bacterium]|nr:ribosome biogenesis GTPase Der [Thermoanaerobaculales bacterium]
MSRQPVIVIVGRPNVGKSTLFNRLTRSRRALVHDLPGVTRDRIVGEAPWRGGSLTVVDTGGLLFEDLDDFIPLIRSQADVAVRAADAVIFLLDGESGLMPEDREIGGWLRALDVPVVPVVNKGDRAEVEDQAAEFYSLGFGESVVISAEHGRGLAELWDFLEPHLAAALEDDELEDDDSGREARIAIVGRPNVGKSSLMNQLVEDSRVLVSDIPGTTRDAVDVVREREGMTFRFVDTAGIRRKGKTDKGPEVLSVVMARRHLERAHLCLLMVDVTEGITRQDAHVGGYAWESGRGVILVVNKWDLVEDRAATRADLEDQMARQLKFMRHSPIVFLSALTGKGVHKLFPVMQRMHVARGCKTSTSDLNRLLKAAWEGRPPASQGRKEPRFYYATQVQSSPPAFVLFTNLTRDPHFSYMRYLENTLRENLGLEGVPIRVMIRGRKN